MRLYKALIFADEAARLAGVMVVAVMIALFTLVAAELLFNMLDRGIEAGVDIRIFRVALPFHALAHMNPDIGAELRAFV